MSIVATIGSASANSFITMADADTYFTARLNASPWFAADDGKKEAALIEAAEALQDDVLNWLGSWVDTTQALSWPRNGVEKIGGNYEWYLTTEIPQQVKDAQCQIALWLLAVNRQPGEASRRVTEWSADGASVSYEYDGSIESFPNAALSRIGKLLADVRIRRG